MTTTTMTNDKALASVGFAPPTSLDNALEISSGVKKSDMLINVLAVAYAENELTKSNKAAPANDGVKIGIPTRTQYSHAFPPKASDASRHCGFIFCNVGRKTKTIKGI